MPSLHTVQATILSQVKTTLKQLTVGFPPVPVSVMAAIGWPSVQMLQANVKGSKAVVSIYDRKMSRDTTRWSPTIIAQTVNATGLISTLSKTVIGPSVVATITLSGTPNAGDAVSLVVNNQVLMNYPGLNNSTNFGLTASAAVAIAASTDTVDTLATALAAAINADAALPEWVTATASGAVVTITSLLTQGNLVLASYTGNTGTQTQEIGRRERQFQIVTWSPTEDIRQAVGDPIEEMITSLQNNFGVTFPDGTVGRVRYGSDFYLEDDTLQDTYRRDFLFGIEYPITQTDILYSVLAPVVQYQLN